MSVALPNASAADSAVFSSRLAALPDELKLGIIGHAVSTPGVIGFIKYGSARNKLTAPFAEDDDLLAMARDQFHQVNTFSIGIDRTRPSGWSPDIAHLELNFAITCTGGYVIPRNPFQASQEEVDWLHHIIKAFPRLESLIVVVDNTGAIEQGAAYLFVNGVVHPAASQPSTMALERLDRMADWSHLVEILELPSWRNGPKTKIKRRLLFQQCKPNASRSVLRIRNPLETEPLTEQYVEDIYRMHDAPAAMLYFGDDEFW